MTRLTKHIDKWWYVYSIAIIAIVVLLMGVAIADAHWKPQYAFKDAKVQQWFQAAKNKHGEWCCSETDGHPYYGDYTLNSDGSVTVNGRVLPEYMVLDGSPNPTGHAVWWYAESGNFHTDYCFAPGAGG